MDGERERPLAEQVRLVSICIDQRPGYRQIVSEVIIFEFWIFIELSDARLVVYVAKTDIMFIGVHLKNTSILSRIS